MKLRIIRQEIYRMWVSHIYTDEMKMHPVNSDIFRKL